MSLILSDNTLVKNDSIYSIIKSAQGHSLTQYNIEKIRHDIMECVYRRKLKLGRDLNLPLFEYSTGLGHYIGSEVIFDQNPVTNKININYIEFYGTASDINAVYEDEEESIHCKYFPRAEAEIRDEDDTPYWFVWASHKEKGDTIDYYRLWM